MNAIEFLALTVFQWFNVNFAKEVVAWTAQSISCAVMTRVERSIALNVQYLEILDLYTNVTTVRRSFVVPAIHWNNVRTMKENIALTVTRQGAIGLNCELSFGEEARKVTAPDQSAGANTKNPMQRKKMLDKKVGLE
jgi:hypothetical protein